MKKNCLSCMSLLHLIFDVILKSVILHIYIESIWKTTMTINKDNANLSLSPPNILKYVLNSSFFCCELNENLDQLQKFCVSECKMHWNFLMSLSKFSLLDKLNGCYLKCGIKIRSVKVMQLQNVRLLTFILQEKLFVRNRNQSNKDFFIFWICLFFCIKDFQGLKSNFLPNFFFV